MLTSSTTYLRCRSWQLASLPRNLLQCTTRLYSTNSTSSTNDAERGDAKPPRKAAPIASSFGDILIVSGRAKPTGRAGERSLASRLRQRRANSDVLVDFDAVVSSVTTGNHTLKTGLHQPKGNGEAMPSQTRRRGSSKSEKRRSVASEGPRSRQLEPRTLRGAADTGSKRGEGRKRERSKDASLLAGIEEEAGAIEPEDYSIDTATTDLKKLFSSGVAPFRLRAIRPAGDGTHKPLPPSVIAQIQRVYERAGDYSRYRLQTATHIIGDSVQTLGPMGLARLEVSRKPEAGLRQREQALEVVSRLTSNVQPVARAQA
ncbi:hypothetical protein K474DRAFT_1770637 [Panus rudis PR-1116 ss-1]|nr:hypothetical protein K474DRAFT_1770637 [Panus rudis PR-1116 ss-1]